MKHLLLFALLGPAALAAAAEPPSRPWFPKAPPLPAPAGRVVRVSTVEQLHQATDQAQAGDTIIVAGGRYRLSRRVEIRADRVTLRGVSRDRNAVVLDGEGTLGEGIGVTACRDVTIGDLTLQNIRWNGIKINSETGVQRLTVRNCVLHNIWQRAIKGVRVPEQDRERLRPHDCRIQYCLFYNDRPKQLSDDSADTAQNFGGNYIGGIDAMFAKGWAISDNVFTGIHGLTNEARGAVFLWHQAEECVVERNVVIDCDTGVCLGNSSLPPDIPVHAVRCIVRNNFVTRAPEGGILADYTRDCAILNNTVYEPKSRFGRLIRLVHTNDGLRVINNLLCGPDIRNESTSRMELRNNLAKDIGSALLAPEEGNLRLTPRAVEAIDHGVPLDDLKTDIDGRKRGTPPDIGASELRVAK